MDKTAILEKTYQLTDYIKSSTLYISYKATEEAVTQDQEVLQFLNEFQKQKQRFEEAYKYGSYYPGFDQIKKTYQQTKIQLMEQPLFKSFKSMEHLLEEEIREIEFQLKAVMNQKNHHKS